MYFECFQLAKTQIRTFFTYTGSSTIWCPYVCASKMKLWKWNWFGTNIHSDWERITRVCFMMYDCHGTMTKAVLMLVGLFIVSFQSFNWWRDLYEVEINVTLLGIFCEFLIHIKRWEPYSFLHIGNPQKVCLKTRISIINSNRKSKIF